MTPQSAQTATLDTGPTAAQALARLAPRPRSIEETGLSAHFLHELTARHLHSGGVLTLLQLTRRLALAGPVVEVLLDSMRADALVEVRGGIDDGSLRYALTERGRAFALDALGKSGYLGPAPVPLHDYTRIVAAQSIHGCQVTREAMVSAFSDVVMHEGLLDQLGPALHSGRALFLYGPAGSGKTYIATLLSRLVRGEILVPGAIALGDQVIQFFDPVYHKPCASRDTSAGIMLGEGHDPRYLCCHRPIVTTGGELTRDMLELAYNPATRQYQAPLQLKANNGLYMIDDLGRQRVSTADLLNRWIVPMEERRDFLSLGSGEHFSIPFEVVLIFSTNLNPLQLADEAFLRRLGYKIRFDYLSTPEFEKIWRQVCEQKAIAFDRELFEWMVTHYYAREQRPMLPCHPRDLIGLANDWSRYRNRDSALTREDIAFAWKSYFVQLEEKDSNAEMS